MPVSKNRKKNRSHKQWKKLGNTLKSSPKTKNADWIKKNKKTC